MTRAHRDDGGQAIILIALSIAALILGIGLAADAGELFVARRAMQTAADAAAWAGATVLYAGGNAATAQTAATTDATRNGYTADSFTTITTASPPTSGTVTGDTGYIEVNITRQVETKLIPGNNAGRTSVSVRAVAGIARSGAGLAVLVLHPTNSNALNLGGNADFTITGGGSTTNSTSASAVNVPAGSLLTGSYHRVTGNVSAGTASRMTPAPTTGVAATADPFASMAGPSTAGLPSFGGQSITSTVTLSPGLYTGLVTVGNGGTARLNSGVYIFRAGFTSTGTGSIVLASAGGGVLIYNTYSNYPMAPGGSPSCGNISWAGSGQLTLAAQKTGSYAGVVLYQDRNCTNNSAFTVRAATSFGGTVYVPSALLTITLAADASMSSQIVASRLTVTGSHVLTLNFTPSAVTGTRVPALVE